MLISPRHGFVFVHVPKCAGTSIRTQIAACDPGHIALAEPGDHPVLGRIDYGHIPLTDLKAHFPEEWLDLQRLPSFAVIRDPLSRFGSSLRQTLWRYEQTPMTLIDPEVLRARMDEILAEVEAGLGTPAAKTIFYARQSDFVFEDGTRHVDHLIPIEHVGAFIRFLSAKTGVAMDADRRSNQNVDLKAKWLGPLAYRVNDTLRRNLPQGLHTRLKDTALGLLASKKSAAETSGVLDLPEVRDFVAQHYGSDTQLYAQAQSEAPALLAQMADGSLRLGERPPA